MNEDLVTNKDIQVRLQLLNCCLGNAGAKMSKNFRQGVQCTDLTTKVIFGFAFIELFGNYYVEENPCVTITEFDRTLQWINNNVAQCGKCFAPYGSFPDGVDYMQICNNFIVG